MSKPAMTLVAPNPKADAERLIDLVAKVFGGYYRVRDWCRRNYVLNCHYDWNASRIGLIDDRVVTHYGVWDYQMQIGRARVRTGGIGAVATDGDFRKRGFMDATARASVEAMRVAGYDFTMLFGIDNFYHRFGYTRAWSDTTYVVRTADLPAGKPPARLRKFLSPARKDILRIYRREHAGMTGAAIRPTFTVEGFLNEMVGYSWSDAKGRTVGYVLVKLPGAALECFEAGGPVDDALRVLASLARRAKAQEVRFSTILRNHPLAVRVRHLNGREEISHHRRGGAMIRTINLPSALGKMAVELESRLRGSGMAAWRGDLRVADGREAAMLTISRGKVRVGPAARSRNAILGGDEIAQFLIGTAPPAEIAQASGTRLTGDAAMLAEVLFPEQHPGLCMADRY